MSPWLSELRGRRHGAKLWPRRGLPSRRGRRTGATPDLRMFWAKASFNLPMRRDALLPCRSRCHHRAVARRCASYRIVFVNGHIRPEALSDVLDDMPDGVLIAGPRPICPAADEPDRLVEPRSGAQYLQLTGHARLADSQHRVLARRAWCSVRRGPVCRSTAPVHLILHRRARRSNRSMIQPRVFGGRLATAAERDPDSRAISGGTEQRLLVNNLVSRDQSLAAKPC